MAFKPQIVAVAQVFGVNRLSASWRHARTPCTKRTGRADGPGSKNPAVVHFAVAAGDGRSFTAFDGSDLPHGSKVLTSWDKCAGHSIASKGWP